MRAAEALREATPNLVRAMAGTAVLEGYLAIAAALARGSVTPPVAERIALAVAQSDGWGYCASSRTEAARRHAHLDPSEIARARDFRSIEPRAHAALRFVQALLDGQGDLDYAELKAARAADLTDVELAEIVGHVALNLLIALFSRAFAIDPDPPDPPAATTPRRAVRPASARRGS